jgi:hypothetical protein
MEIAFFIFFRLLCQNLLVAQEETSLLLAWMKIED